MRLSNVVVRVHTSFVGRKGPWYCALADGPRSYGAGQGPTAKQAKLAALGYANKVAPGAHIVLVVGGSPATIWQEK